MPTYDYECQKCGHRFEVFQSMKDERLTDCPLETCDGRVKRLLGTGAGIIFKGSGFYETDYRSASYQKAASADKPSDSSGGGSSGASPGESKTAAAAPAARAAPAPSTSGAAS